jgi:peptidoglycan/LPS O-acetylase OafA/YrhL
VRFSAALVVFFGHVSGQRLTGGLLWQFGSHMTEAVTVFFVLSGFVIGYVADTKEHSAGSYAVARAARIYSVALPALIITFGLDAIGRTIHPELYSESWGYIADGQVWQFLSGVFFVNELWYTHITQGSCLPYVSLGYEVWYYVIFGIAMFAPARWRVIGVIVALCIIGPKITLMFPLWLLGLWCYHHCARHTMSRIWGVLLCVGSLIGWVGYDIWARHHVDPLFSAVPAVFTRPDSLQIYLVAVLFTCHLLGFHSISNAFSGLSRFGRQIRWVAGTTFTLYLLHVPIAQFLSILTPWPPQSWANRIMVFGGTLVLVFLIAEVTERRKDWWRRGFASLLQWATCNVNWARQVGPPVS